MEFRSQGRYYLLSSIFLFHSLSDNEKNIIAERCQIKDLKRHENLYHKGQDGDYFYIIINGSVEVYLPTSSETSRIEEVVDILRKGDTLGIVSILEKKPHSFSARALGNVRLLLAESDYCHYLTYSDNITKEEFFKSANLEQGKLRGSYLRIIKVLRSSGLKDINKLTLQISREVTGVRCGLALGGGAAFGLSQIGVLKVLEKENIKIDMVLVDGGVVNPLPVSTLSAQGSDVYLSPILPNSSWYEFYRAQEFIDFGEKVCDENLREIKKLVRK